MIQIDSPHFHRWDKGFLGADWSFGWLTGRNRDLITLKPNIYTELSEPSLSTLLSPICSNRFLAFCAFIMKVLLVRIDQNLKRSLKSDSDR